MYEDAAGSSEPRPAGDLPARIARVLALAMLCALPFLRFVTQPDVPAWGWDESMHAELPAVRMLLHATRGETRSAAGALLECAQYPFAYPVLLAGAQGMFGVSEWTGRWLTVALFSVAILGLWRIGRELGRRPGLASGCSAPGLWIALVAATCPLAHRFAGTLFLEVPFTCVAVLTVLAWLRRAPAAPGPRLGREVLAGGLWLVCFFTKFNYALLLGLGLGLDWLWDAVAAGRRGELASCARRSGALVALPALGLAWWFLLPLPGGLDHAALHSRAFLGFLRGNLEMAPVSGAMRTLHWVGAFVPRPAVFVALCIGALASLRFLRQPPVRTLWILLLATGVPVWLHPFHLDRFLIPGAIPIWILAGLGWSSLASRAVARPALPITALLVVLLALPVSTDRVAGWVGIASASERVRAYQRRVFADWAWGRGVASQGLAREQAERLGDLVAAEVGPDARVGWLALSSEYSPAALHVDLLRRGGSAERFLRDAQRSPDVGGALPGHPAPDWKPEVFERFASGFDVFFWTRPLDLKGRPGRPGFERYLTWLTEDLGWRSRRLGQLQVDRSPGEPLAVEVFAARPDPTRSHR